ncbi:MAG: RNA methyltransferase [Alphaproteobacteria bacterium]
MSVHTGPAIILVAPQLAENIGTAARAMANFGLRDLRLVNPRDGWPSDKARAAASRADHVIDAVRVYDTPEAAVEDLGVVFATTARNRDVNKRVVGPQQAVEAMRRHDSEGTRCGVLFGRERSGLTNEEVSLADEILTFPVNPDFSSLNIAQAVLLVAYEYRLTGLEGGREGLTFDDPVGPPATKHDLMGLFGHFEAALDRAGFFRPPERRPTMVLSLRAMLQRAGLSEQEVRTFRGVLAAFERQSSRPPLDGQDATTALPEDGDR